MSTPDSARHERASALFLRARALPEDAREAFLESECADDPELRTDVLSLLASDAPEDDTLDQPALGGAFQLTPSMLESIGVSEASTPIPRRIGEYRVLGVLGVGGMGIVYRAEQNNPVRDVAVKVVRPGSGAGRTARRLAHEAQLLALLQHDAIASVLHAGVFDSEAGPQPYFAMELIEGRPLIEFVRERNSPVRERLELLAKICDAVQYAHEKGVIHRDLKPANVLVTSAGQPKILDFGVARATDSDLQLSTLQTHVGQLIGTLSYMSPEQVVGDPTRIDSRSDVYALGVILYELLVGHLPHDLANVTIPEAARIIRDEEPTALVSFGREFRGDLDTIVRTALEKDAGRRYPSAAALAEDVRRHLRDEPIAVRPPSAVYQLRKFARRNRALVGGVVAVFIVLVAGITGTTIGMLRAVRNEERVATELVKAEQAMAFLRDLIGGANPWIAVGRDTTLLRAILQDSSARIDSELAGEPEVEVHVRAMIGDTYRAIGDFDEAQRHLERARELAEQNLLPDHPSFLETRRNLGHLCLAREQDDAALALFEENLGQLPTFSVDPRVETLRNLDGVLKVHAFRGLPKRVIEVTDEVLPAALERFGLATDAVQDIQLARANALWNLEEYERSETLYRELLQRRLEQFGRDHPLTTRVLWGLAKTYRKRGMIAAAEPLYRDYFESCRRVFGDDHETTNSAKNSFALILKELGEFDEALRLLTEVLEFNRRECGELHQYTDIALYNLAAAHDAAGQHGQAETLMHDRLANHREQYGETDQRTLLALVNLAEQQMHAERHEEAIAMYEDAIATGREAGIEPSFLGYFLLEYGEALVATEHYPEAESALLEAWELLVAAFTGDHFQPKNTAAALSDLYRRWNRPGEMERWRLIASDS